MQKHRLLRGLIRGTGIFVAGSSALGLLVILPMMGLAFFRHTQSQSWLTLLFLIIPTAVSVILILVGYKMFRKIEVISIANFAFIFSYLVAKIFYHFLPSYLPRIFGNYVRNDHFEYRSIVSFAAFLIFYCVIKEMLLQVLELNHNDRLQNPEIPGPDVPEFPKKSPLIPL